MWRQQLEWMRVGWQHLEWLRQRLQIQVLELVQAQARALQAQVRVLAQAQAQAPPQAWALELPLEACCQDVLQVKAARCQAASSQQQHLRKHLLVQQEAQLAGRALEGEHQQAILR